MVNILITLLTSNERNLKWLRQSVYAAQNQQNHDADDYNNTTKITICIIVNSTSSQYFNCVAKEFPNIWCVPTISNGLPGKGHNSALNIFKYYRHTSTHELFDYLIPLDGDDFLYPVAVSRIVQHIKLSKQHNCPINVLLLPFSDSLTQRCLLTTLSVEVALNIHLKYNNYICSDVRRNSWIESATSLSPFAQKNDMNQYKTSARIILVSQKGLTLGFRYCEQSWLDDLLPFVHLCYQSSRFGSKQTGIYLLNDCDIFLYNRLPPGSATTHLCKLSNIQKILQFNILKKTILKKYKFNWDVTKILFLPVLQPSKFFTMEDKIQFCRKTLRQIQNLMDGLICIKSTYIRPSNVNAKCDYFINKATKEKHVEMVELYTRERNINQGNPI